MLYFEFEGKRRKADVTWPEKGDTIVVHVTDTEIAKKLPTDLYFDVRNENEVSYTIEDRDNKRLIELQNVIRKRLQEFVNQ